MGARPGDRTPWTKQPPPTKTAVSQPLQVENGRLSTLAVDTKKPPCGGFVLSVAILNFPDTPGLWYYQHQPSACFQQVFGLDGSAVVTHYAVVAFWAIRFQAL